MTYRLLQLPPDSYDFILSRIESGRYESPGQLVQAAFRALHREESEFRNKPVTSTIAEEDAFRKLWENEAESITNGRKVERQD